MSSDPRGGPWGNLVRWAAIRVPLAKFSFAHLKEKEVPIHRLGFIYNLGGLALCAFVVQVLTGLLLVLYYQPTTAAAYDSVQFICRDVPGGMLVRSLHTWSANAMIFLVFLHAATVALSRAYRRPRELTWVTGVFLSFLVLAMGFSGYLLPWNMLSVYATKVGTQIIGASTEILPGPLSELGALVALLLVGSEPIGQQALTRFFALHVVVIPLVLAMLIGIHLLLIQLHGLSIPPVVSASAGEDSGEDDGGYRRRVKAEAFFPTFALKEAGLWLCFVGVLVVVADLLPYEYLIPYTLAARYDPLAPAPLGIKPEWYFYWMYYPLEMMPRAVAIAIFAAFMLCLLLFPWLMYAIPRLWRAEFAKSKFPEMVSVAVLVIIVVLTLFGQNVVEAARALSGHAYTIN